MAAPNTKFTNVEVTGNLTVGGTTIDNQQLTDDLTVATNKKIQFRDTGIFLQSGADGKLTISADGSGADDISLAGTVTLNALLTLAANGLSQLSFPTTSRSATSDGSGTGTIADGTGFVVAGVDTGNNDILVLPTPTPGTVVFIHTTAIMELRSSTPASVAINGGTGASAESALPANCLVVAICVTATAWLALQIASDGTVAGVEAAA